jgi:hypothetical protein
MVLEKIPRYAQRGKEGSSKIGNRRSEAGIGDGGRRAERTGEIKSC